MKRDLLTRVQFIFSMLVFGSIGLFVRGIPLASGEIALWRAVLAALLVGLYLLITKTNPVRGVTRRDLLLLLASGAAMGFNWILLFEAYRYTSVSLATLCYYFAPILVTVLSPILFREKMTLRGILCFAGSTTGLVLIVGATTGGTGTDLIGALLGLGAALLYATVMLLNKYIKSATGLPRTFLQFLSAILVLVPYVALTGGFGVFAMRGSGWLYLLAVGVIHTGVTYCLYFSALWRLPGQVASILSYLDPLVAVILSVALLREPITPWQVVGGVLILGFSLANEIRFKKRSA